MFTSKDFSKVITNSSITLCFNNNAYTVKSDSPIYSKLLKAIREDRWNDVPTFLDPSKEIDNFSNGEFSVRDGLVAVKEEGGGYVDVPQELSKMIMFYIDNDLPSEPLVKFARSLNRNPSKHSISQLFSFINHNKLTITKDGNFIAYKKVRDDYKDCHTGTFDNSIGVTVTMPRTCVEDDPNVTCAKGLHCSNFQYASQFYGGSGSGRLVLVEVQPEHVVSVPTDYQNAKIRACQYKVLADVTEELKEHIWSGSSSDEDGTDYSEDDEDLDSDYEG